MVVRMIELVDQTVLCPFSGKTVVVGAVGDDDYGSDSGSAYIYDLTNIDTTASCGKGIEFDGINDWINIPDLRLADDFTIEGWFKIAPGIDYRDAIFGQEGSGPDIHFSAGRVRLYAYGIRVTAKTPLIADTWGHIAITRSGTKLNGVYQWCEGCDRTLERNTQYKSHRSR